VPGANSLTPPVSFRFLLLQANVLARRACYDQFGSSPALPVTQKPVALARTTHNEIGDYFLCRYATQKIITKYHISNCSFAKVRDGTLTKS
jgi:hypothetical protein